MWVSRVVLVGWGPPYSFPPLHTNGKNSAGCLCAVGDEGGTSGTSSMIHCMVGFDRITSQKGDRIDTAWRVVPSEGEEQRDPGACVCAYLMSGVNPPYGILRRGLWARETARDGEAKRGSLGEREKRAC